MMAAFTEDEQWYSDFDWYAVDEAGNIGQFLTGGHRAMPPKIAANKEDWQKLSDYFNNLPATGFGFVFCPDVELNFESEGKELITERFMPYSQTMASRGLFSYDSKDFTYQNRPYIRVAIPKQRLKLDDLPKEIRGILENLRMPIINFDDDSLISEEITNQI